MKPLTLALLVSLAAVYSVLAQDPAPARTLPIRGRVVDARDGVPLRRARVLVTVGDRRLDTVVADDEGRFQVVDAPAAALTVRATKAGYAPALLTVPAEVGAGELRFALARGAAVMGRVLDSFDAPVVDAYVTGRLILPAADTTPAAARQFFTRTDGLGEYRLGGLAPGRYEIMAARVPVEARGPGTKIEDVLFGPPAPLEVAKGALTLVLAEGDEIQGVDFTSPGSSETCPLGPSRRPPEGVVMATISGRVTGASGEPLACASVEATSLEMSGPTVFTDPQGRYSIAGLPAGSYILRARKTGYIGLQSGQRRPSDAETPIALRDKEQRSRVDFVLPRGSIVSGTVVDEYGEPVEEVRVWAFRLGWVEGRTLAMSTEPPRSTDDRGQYRLIGLDPGTYIVAAMPRGAVPAAGGQQALAYVSHYYPGTPDPLTAQRVVLDGGGNEDGIDIAFTPTRTATVSGSVLDAMGRPVAGTVNVSVSGRSGAVSVDSWSAPIDASGGFVVRHVPPGDYVVKAFDETRRFGMQYVTVGDGAPPTVTLTVFEGATIDGSVTVEGASSPDGQGILVTAVPTDSDFSPGLSGLAVGFTSTPLQQGRFHISRVTGPARLLVMTPSCEGCYVRSVLVNGADATDTPFDFGLTGVYRDVDIVVSDAGAAIEGRATDERDAAVTAYSVVVFSTHRELWYSRSPHRQAGRSAQDGSFRVTGLPPGEYFVAAVNRLDPFALIGELNDPELLEQLSRQAERVTLSERDRRRLNPRLIRR